MIGGAGNDEIFGDSDWLATGFDWSVSEEQGERLYAMVIGIDNLLGGEADTIYGGGGNDYVQGRRVTMSSSASQAMITGRQRGQRHAVRRNRG
jgi:Ca2+-binding RTX toxin-like protein